MPGWDDRVRARARTRTRARVRGRGRGRGRVRVRVRGRVSPLLAHRGRVGGVGLGESERHEREVDLLRDEVALVDEVLGGVGVGS